MRALKAVLFMHKDRPVARMFGAVPGFSLGLRVLFVMVLGAGVFSATALGAAAPKAKAGETKAAVSSDFVGSETCATCHDEVSKKFADNPHTRMAQMHGGSGVTCENCHGAGKAHVEGGGDVSKIFNPIKHSPKEVDEKCLSCHAGTHPNFERSPHAKANVSCISCHSVHESKANTKLLKASQPTLCFQCHSDVKPAFGMPFHHKVNEGLVKCTDCHDAHGTFNANNLKSTADQNMVCTKCHTDVRGPFVFEHTPVRSEGCVACHTPHGSQNPRLLNMPSIATLCNQCHSPVGAGTVHGQGQGSVTATSCINCHTMIHGSNLSQAFIR
jgi:DmsE family decaheme c-type cytochrome